MKILFFRLGAIGDALLTTPAIRKARELFPDAEIHYLAGEAASKALENNPHIDRLFVMRKTKTLWPRDFEAMAQAKFLSDNFRDTVYDYFIDFESSPFSAVLSFFIRARRKIGHIIRRKRKFLFNMIYGERVDHKDGEFYIIHRHLALMKEIGHFENTDNSLVLRLTPDERKAGEKFYEAARIKPGDLKILFSVSSTWQTKEWPAAYWEKLAVLINAEMPAAKIIVLWGPGDSKELTGRLSGLKNVSIIPETGLREMAAIAAFGDIMIANDGATRHIGVALGLKTVGLFGPTTEKGWAFADEHAILIRAPRELCRPCHRADCRYKTGCMDRIKPETVFEAVKNILTGAYTI